MDTDNNAEPTLPDLQHIPTQPLTTLPKKQSTWLPLLVLFFLAPAIGEGLSGSTPFFMFLNPLLLLFQAGLYGSGAILVRELVRRRGLGWINIFILGMAYGILEEALVVTSWFDPYWPDLGKLAYYGRFLDTSWIWAIELTLYHAVVSITIPIVLVELLFPQIASKPWLGKRGFRGHIVIITLVSLIGLAGFGFLLPYNASHGKGYTHPPLMYFGALLMAIGLVWFALRFRSVRLVNSEVSLAPRLWLLRVTGFLSALGFFFTAWALPNIVDWPLVPMVLFIAFALSGFWRVASWSKRPDWDEKHRLALATGVLCFFGLLAPIIEFSSHRPDKPAPGQTVIALLFLGALFMLAWRLRKHGQGSQQSLSLR